MSSVKTMACFTALALFSASSVPTMAQSGDELLCQQFVYNCDGDGDGEASLAEFESCGHGGGAEGFSAMDANQDGSLTCAEVIVFHRS